MEPSLLQGWFSKRQSGQLDFLKRVSLGLSRLTHCVVSSQWVTNMWLRVHIPRRARSLTAETLGMALYGGSQRPMTFWRARSPESHLSPLTYENKIKTTYVRLTNILIVSCAAARSQCVCTATVLVGYHLVCRWKKNSVWRNMGPPWICLFSTILRKWIQLRIPSLSVDHFTVNSEIKKFTGNASNKLRCLL